MKLRFNGKQLVANRVFHLIDLPKKLHEYLIVRPYKNGREEGWTVETWGKNVHPAKVSFSEHRNSDSIVVYAGPASEFDEYGVPSDKLYEDDAARRFFDYGDYAGAAKFISRFLATYKY